MGSGLLGCPLWEPHSPGMVELKAEDEGNCSVLRSLEQPHGVSGWGFHIFVFS